ncbi:hypothetical protein F5141DRAFT_1065459 [Pisolithus sp. B1]|nr:hypothetical protein F5141DRAFT_1065459 [Pisolithus sp. B1]
MRQDPLPGCDVTGLKEEIIDLVGEFGAIDKQLLQIRRALLDHPWSASPLYASALKMRKLRKRVLRPEVDELNEQITRCESVPIRLLTRGSHRQPAGRATEALTLQLSIASKLPVRQCATDKIVTILRDINDLKGNTSSLCRCRVTYCVASNGCNMCQVKVLTLQSVPQELTTLKREAVVTHPNGLVDAGEESMRSDDILNEASTQPFFHLLANNDKSASRVPKVFDAFSSDKGYCLMVMEKIAGPTLSDCGISEEGAVEHAASAVKWILSSEVAPVSQLCRKSAQPSASVLKELLTSFKKSRRIYRFDIKKEGFLLDSNAKSASSTSSLPDLLLVGNAFAASVGRKLGALEEQAAGWLRRVQEAKATAHSVYPRVD